MLPTATMLLKLQDETGALGLIAPGCKRRPSKALWQLLTQCLREDDFNRRQTKDLARPPASLVARVETVVKVAEAVGGAVVVEPTPAHEADYGNQWTR
eukprot:gene30868-27808_t